MIEAQKPPNNIVTIDDSDDFYIDEPTPNKATDDTAPSSIVAAKHPSAHADVHPVASNPLIMKQDSEGRSWWEHQVSKAFTDIGAPRPAESD